MRNVVAHLFSSLDGVVSSPHLFQFDSFGAEEGEAMARALANVDEAVMGRVIYTEWADYWPQHDEDFGLVINPMRKHVASRSLSGELDWTNSELIPGDLLEFVRELKAGEGGEITVCGISIVRQLLAADLLDALTLTIHPVLAGQGQRLFEGESEPLRLELIDSQITAVGNAILTYRRRAEQG